MARAMRRRDFVRLAALAGLGAAGGAVPGCRRPLRGNGRNVLLVTIETTRADHVGAYGYARETTPRFDAWSAGGVLFEQHSSVSPRTNPSVASILTARYPHEHGTRSILLPLERECRSLGEIFRDAGYRTAGIQTHPRLVSASGFGQGFDEYLDDFRGHPRADQSLGLAWEWIESASRGRRPWFLWVHVMDPHWPYEPPESWASRFGPPDPRPQRLYEDLRAKRRRIGQVIFRNEMPPDEVAAFVNLYDAEIRFTDEELGRLLGRLERAGLSEKTAVCVTADHGESLGEHDYFFEHGDLGTEPEIRVPLAIALPGAIPAAVRVPWTTRSIDIAPTLLDLAGLPAEGTFRGSSLAPYWNGGTVEDRPCFGETDRSLHEENDRREVEGVAGKRRWVRLGPYKLVHVPRRDGPPERHLFDVRADFAESRDLFETEAEVAGLLGRMLDAWLAEDAGFLRPTRISPELYETLRSLGYVN
jgi:arylsulfatase A-like enzyme